MGIFSNASQVVYAAAAWVFGGDTTLTDQEQIQIRDCINSDKTPWSVEDNDIKFVNSVWAGVSSLEEDGYLLSNILEAIEYEFDFSLEEKYLLYYCICVPMNALGQGNNSADGWNRANELLSEMGIELDDYNRWAN